MSKSSNLERLHKRHARLFRAIHFLATPFFRSKYNYTYDDLSKIEGPYLLLSNHNTNYDPIFVGMAAKNQLYFVSSEHVSRNRFLWTLLNFVFAPILHYKGKAGVNTISAMLRTLKAGYSVAIFPEGNRSFNGQTCEYLPTIGKLARKSGAKLITYRMEGGYFTQPRWSFTDRKGKLVGKLIHVYELDELKSMTDDEVNAAIVKDLYEDAYVTEAKEKIPFKGKRLAYGLESTLFVCPKCKKIGTLHSTDTHLECSCGYKAEYTVYGMLEEKSNSLSVTEADAIQRKVLKDMIDTAKDKPEELLFKDEVVLMQIDKDHKIGKKRTAILSAYSDRVTVDDKEIKPVFLQGVAIRSRNTIVAHTLDNIQYEVKGTSEVFNALKYLYLYETIK